jgi:signal transduction histidine kinase
LIAIFTEESVSGATRGSRAGPRLRSAEAAVVVPLARLSSSDRREYLQAEAVAAAADRLGFRIELATSLLALMTIGWFAVFAVRLVRRIENQNIELQFADAAKDEFIATVSHELRTPLTSMHGYVELLLDKSGDPLTPEQRSFLATVQRGSTRLEGLINDLLLTAQLRSGRLELHTTNADLAEIARQAIESAQAHAANKTLELNLTAPPHPITIEADAMRLAQALDNLISNAIKFTPPGGRVEVALTQDTERVTLTVSDTGMGMTSADIEHLFEPFTRTDAAKQIQGTGLGLPIVKAIIDGHEGIITVTSEPNVGTSFAISLARTARTPACPGLVQRQAALPAT